jgi:hypothetical protein
MKITLENRFYYLVIAVALYLAFLTGYFAGRGDTLSEAYDNGHMHIKRSGIFNHYYWNETHKNKCDCNK